MMKKWYSLLLAAAMLFSLAACGSPANVEGTPAPPESTPVASATPAPEGEGADSGLSPTVQQLYQEFDAAMEAQIGAMPEQFGEIKVGAVVISLTNPFWVNMKNYYEAAGEEMEIGRASCRERVY